MHPAGLVTENDATIDDRRGAPNRSASFVFPNHLAFVCGQTVQVMIAGADIDFVIGQNRAAPNADMFAAVTDVRAIGDESPGAAECGSPINASEGRRRSHRSGRYFAGREISGMRDLLISLLVFALIFGGALVGAAVRPLLSERHLNPDSKDVVKMATALIGTLTALVLGWSRPRKARLIRKPARSDK